MNGEVLDTKVVQMQFDNKDFENRVKETMTTLDRFKAKLNFTPFIREGSNFIFQFFLSAK